MAVVSLIELGEGRQGLLVHRRTSSVDNTKPWWPWSLRPLVVVVVFVVKDFHCIQRCQAAAVLKHIHTHTPLSPPPLSLSVCPSLSFFRLSTLVSFFLFLLDFLLYSFAPSLLVVTFGINRQSSSYDSWSDFLLSSWPQRQKREKERRKVVGVVVDLDWSDSVSIYLKEKKEREGGGRQARRLYRFCSVLNEVEWERHWDYEGAHET